MADPTPRPRAFYLLEWRHYFELTQAELAQRAGMSTTRVSAIESGETRYNETQLAAIARGLTDPVHLVEPWMLLAGPPEVVLPLAEAKRTLRPAEIKAAAQLVGELRQNAFTAEPAPPAPRRRVRKPQNRG